MKLNRGNLPKIKIGQIWTRRRDGLEIEIVDSKGSDTFRCKNLRNSKVQHHIAKKTLWIYWEPKGSKEKYGLN